MHSVNPKDGSSLHKERLSHGLALGSSGGQLQLGSGSGLAERRGGRCRCCRNLGHLGTTGAKESGDAGSAGETVIGTGMGGERGQSEMKKWSCSQKRASHVSKGR